MLFCCVASKDTEAAVHFLSLKKKEYLLKEHGWKMFTNSAKEKREGKIKRSFAGVSKTREDSREGALHCVCMIGCDGSEAFTRIYECLF